MASPLATATAFGRLSNEPGRALLTVRNQHAVVDSPPPLDGPNEAMNPIEMLLCALASCGVFICERVAAEMGIPLASVDITAAGDFDPRGVCGEPVDPRLQHFRLRVSTSGPDAAQREALVDAFRRRCPVLATFAAGGATIDITTHDAGGC